MSKYKALKLRPGMADDLEDQACTIHLAALNRSEVTGEKPTLDTYQEGYLAGFYKALSMVIGSGPALKISEGSIRRYQSEKDWRAKTGDTAAKIRARSMRELSRNK